MKRLPSRLALVAFAVCLGAATLCGAEEMTRLAPEDFVILPWARPSDDPEALALMYECGFNLAGLVKPETLDAVAAAGLKGIVRSAGVHVSDAVAELDDAEIEQRVTELVAQVADHEAAFGYFLRDEPSADPFPGLGKWVEAFRRADPDRPALINLFPNYATPEQLAAPTYEDYLESYIAMVNPAFICYDHYALMEDGSLRAGYFANLEIVRRVALEHDLPFYNVVLSAGLLNYAEPSPAGFRFQLYTTLAYGARGIGYFEYFTRATGNFRLGPIDQFGHKTPTWDMLRNVNLQLHALGPTYLTLRSINVFHYPNVPEGSSGIETTYFLDELRGGDLLVGEFEAEDGRPFVMIVNKDLHRSTPFVVVAKTQGGIEFVDAYSGQMRRWSGENNWLAPGQGMLLGLPRP